jgi:predicted secreted protein
MSAATRVAATIVAAFVVFSLVTTAPVAAQTADETASVTIGDIDVEPANPTTDSRTILTPTITNSETATGNAKLTEVSIRSGGVLNTADNLGRLGAGDSVEVPLAHTFDTPGERRITVSARGTNPDGSVFVVQKAVYLDTARESRPSREGRVFRRSGNRGLSRAGVNRVNSVPQSPSLLPD